MSCEMGHSSVQVAEGGAEWGVLEIKVRLPRRDPRFAALLAQLDSAAGRRGRGSPLPRMLMEYALAGFLLTNSDGKAKK